MGKKCSHLLQIVCFIIFFAVWIIDSFILNLSTFASFFPSALRIPSSLCIIAVGSILVGKAHRVLFKKKSRGLITTGIFARVRHPMYLGIILIYLGYMLGTMSLLSILPWLLIVYLYAKMADHEERVLEEQFGKEYLEYKRRVPKWIPKFTT